MRITDEAVEAGAQAIVAEEAINKSAFPDRRDLARAALEAALPHLSQGAVRVSEEILIAAFLRGENWRRRNDVDRFIRVPEMVEKAARDYADVTLSALSPAPVGVMDGVNNAASDLLASIDPERLNPEQFNAWSALAAALASHEPAPTDTQEGPEVVGWSYEYHDFGEIWPRGVILNRPDGGANPPTAHHGSPVRSVTPLVRLSTLTACQQEVEKADANAMAWGAELKSAEARILELEADLEVANDKLRKMAEALEPFAEVAFDEHADLPDNTVVVIKHEKLLDVTFTLGDFRRARATLGGQSNE